MSKEDAPNFRHYDERRCPDCIDYIKQKKWCSRFNIDLNGVGFKVCDDWKCAYNDFAIDLRDK